MIELDLAYSEGFGICISFKFFFTEGKDFASALFDSWKDLAIFAENALMWWLLLDVFFGS